MKKTKPRRKKVPSRKRKAPLSKTIQSDLIPKPNLPEYLGERLEKLRIEEETADPERREALKLVIEEVEEIEDDVEMAFTGHIPCPPTRV